MDFVSRITAELDKRSKLNSSYSLRAFSRDLGIDSSNLSKIINRKTKAHKSTQEKILLKIGLDPLEIKKILDSSSSSSFKEKFNELNIKEFEMISEWYHDAILELTRLSFFKAEYKWIAQTLGISEIQAKLAVDRLKDFGYLKVEDGIWTDISGDNTINIDPNYTSLALRNLQLSILDKSKDAIKNTPIEDRSHTSTLLTVNKNDIQEVKKRINIFRSEISKFLEENINQADSLYQIHIGFFPLIKKEKK